MIGLSLQSTVPACFRYGAILKKLSRGCASSLVSFLLRLLAIVGIYNSGGGLLLLLPIREAILYLTQSDLLLLLLHSGGQEFCLCFLVLEWLLIAALS